ncbi:unnamed protein product [Allacma fusca]|uniref:THAP-type domain-containing protein n=1 Tax=Allacma fusca TaxID=39272 RepID=A0A8J2JY69_9HEXA|nr:unnamed protein product [Allacma fusca]
MGRKSCIIRHCRFLRAGAGEIVTIHRFPACPMKRQPWISFVEHCNGISLAGVSWMNCYLCSRHFHPNSLTKPGPGRRVRPGHNPRLMITPVGGFREFIPTIQSSNASNSVKEERMEMEDGGNSERSNSEAEPESIWCHPLLDGMECGEESGERSNLDRNIAAENEELKEKLRATEQIFDTCHRSLKEKETMIQELREMVKMKQRKVRRLEERISQLEASQMLASTGVAKTALNDLSAIEGESAAIEVEPEFSLENLIATINTQAGQQAKSLFSSVLENSNYNPTIVQLLEKLYCLSPRYHELVLHTLNNCLSNPVTSTTGSSPVKRDEEVVCPIARDQQNADNPASDPKAARLRVGRPKANVITACREAIRLKNMESLTRVIKHGA